MSAFQSPAFRHFSDVLLTLYRTALNAPHDSTHDTLLAWLHQAIAFDQAIWDCFKLGRKEHARAFLQSDGPLASTSFFPAASRKQIHQPQHNCFRLSLCLPKTNSVKTNCEILGPLQQAKNTASKPEHMPSDDAEDGITHVLHLFRLKSKTPFSRSEQSLLETIFPHLHQALQIHQRQQLEHLMQQCPSQTAALLTDRHGLIHQASAGCTSLLRAEFIAHADQHSLPCELLDHLKECPEPYRGQHLVATCTPCSTQALMGVLLRPAHAVDQLPARQRQVSELAVLGLNHKQTAQRLGLAPATIRNQLQLIYKRLNTHGSAALTQLIMHAP